MADRIRITQRPRTPAAYTPPVQGKRKHMNGNMLVLVTTTITAASYNSTNGNLELGKGQGTLQQWFNSSGTDVTQKVPRSATIDVYNAGTSEVAAGAEAYVWCERNQQDGKVYVQLGGGGDELYAFTLTEDMGATTAGEASATVSKPDGSGSGTQTVKDHPAGIFAELKTSNTGWVIKVGSDYWIIQSDCVDPPYEEGSGDGSLSGEGSFILV